MVLIQQRPGRRKECDSATDKRGMLRIEYIYPYYKVVVLKACPGVIKLDPVLMSKYLRADAAAQLIQIQVELPAVLVQLRAGWRKDDGLTMFGDAVEEIFTKLGLR